MANKLKRYSPVYYNRPGSCLLADDEGDYVQYVVAQQQIDAANERARKLRDVLVDTQATLEMMMAEDRYFTNPVPLRKVRDAITEFDREVSG